MLYDQEQDITSTKRTGNMKEQIQTLVTIQDIEGETAEIQQQLAGAYHRIEEMENRLKEKRKQEAEKEGTVSQWKISYRDFDLTLKSNHEMVLRSQERLKSVKTNREYQALLKEVEELKKQNARIEDEMIKLMGDIESGEAQLVQNATEIQSLAAEIEAEKSAVEESTQYQRLRLKELGEKKSQYTVKTEPGLLKLFNRVRTIHSRGNAVVQAIDAVCEGCHMNIPHQLYNELQRCDSIKLCPNCQRIIYWQQPECTDK